MTNRTDQLKQLMADNDLTPEKVATMLNRSVQTVRIWRCKSDGRNIPEHTLELLKAKTGTVSPPLVECDACPRSGGCVGTCLRTAP